MKPFHPVCIDKQIRLYRFCCFSRMRKELSWLLTAFDYEIQKSRRIMEDIEICHSQRNTSGFFNEEIDRLTIEYNNTLAEYFETKRKIIEKYRTLAESAKTFSQTGLTS